MQPSVKHARSTRCSSREAGFPAELEVELAAKPNVARVLVEGGDYSNPIDAMNDRDKWCDVPSLSLTDSCQLLIGPGTFPLAEPLNLPDKFDVLGAVNTCSQRTELVAQSGVDAAIQLVGVGAGERFAISDLRVRNRGGANGNARGIWALEPDENGFDSTIRNVSVEVSGGVADATTGTRVGPAALRNVEVSVNGGSNAVGISTRCGDGADVRVAVEAFDAQSSTGWGEASDCGTEVVQFDVSVRGPNSIGMRFNTMDSAELSEGTVVAGGIGIAIAGGTHLRNLRVAASTAIQCLFCDSTLLDNIHVPDSETALDLGRQFFSVQVTDSTLFGEILVPADPFNIAALPH